jgi:hypothetical protein
MVPLLIDENIDGDVVSGVRRRYPQLDIVRVQEVGLRTAGDPVLLEWAAKHGRVIVSKDRQTLIGLALDWVSAGLPMPGLLVLKERASIGQMIESVLIAGLCSTPGEWDNLVQYLP